MSKLALLIGINYSGQSKALNGCINDVKHLQDMLQNKMAYKEKNMIVMTDDLDKENQNYPTAQNIILALRRLIITAHQKKSKEIWIHFSGHSVSIADKNGDESDGRDEAIVPVDYQERGVISDDVLHKYMRYIPKETNCVAFFDSCHSGTILDLKYIHQPHIFNRVENGQSNKNLEGKVMMFSGCRDNEKSVGFLENGKNWVGAMTRSLLNTLEQHDYEISCRELLDGMQKYMIVNGFTQRPQLSTSFKLQKYSIFCKQHSEKPFIRALNLK
tara:strand:- start:707 stop:1522 length:816 start_codon:yes stop_codon:yes gene_type:complete